MAPYAKSLCTLLDALTAESALAKGEKLLERLIEGLRRHLIIVHIDRKNHVVLAGEADPWDATCGWIGFGCGEKVLFQAFLPRLNLEDQARNSSLLRCSGENEAAQPGKAEAIGALRAGIEGKPHGACEFPDR